MPRQFTSAERAAIKAAAPRESHAMWDQAMDLGADPRLARRLSNGIEVDAGPAPPGTIRRMLVGGVEVDVDVSGRPQKALILGRLKHLVDGTPIDTDLHAGPPGFLAAGKANLGYGFRLRGSGGYEVESGGVTTTIGPPDYWTGSQWRVLPLTQREIVANRVEWDTPQGMFRVFVLPHLVGTELHLTGPEHASGWRFSISETGGKVAIRDGSWVAKGAFGTIPVTFTDGFLVYAAPDLTGVTGLVEVRL